MDFLMATGTDISIASMTVRLLISLVMGALIGLDRETSGHPAGVRTFSFVCLGACLTMITGEYLFTVYSQVDPSRIAAQVISGIGFLGVGTIVVTGKNFVRGLSTAASLWASAALGIAVGSGMILESVIFFGLMMFVVLVLTPLSHRVDETNRKIELYLEIEKGDYILKFFDHMKNQGYEVQSFERQKSESVVKSDIALLVSIDLKKRRSHSDVIGDISSLSYVRYAEEIK
ncbi:MAG: MgtC/SapB family protein [Candidatus Weimeria sp.]